MTRAPRGIASLTGSGRTANFVVMSFLAPRSKTGKLRLIGAGLLLFVFFLPLHSHFSAPAQLAKECSCVHGSRTQMGPASVQISAAPQVLAEFIATAEPRLYAWRPVTWEAIRAPPYNDSL
jgi:hypothetical protein